MWIYANKCKYNIHIILAVCIYIIKALHHLFSMCFSFMFQPFLSASAFWETTFRILEIFSTATLMASWGGRGKPWQLVKKHGDIQGKIMENPWEIWKDPWKFPINGVLMLKIKVNEGFDSMFDSQQGIPKELAGQWGEISSRVWLVQWIDALRDGDGDDDDDDHDDDDDYYYSHYPHSSTCSI